jgi:hypothetical protein
LKIIPAIECKPCLKFNFHNKEREIMPEIRLAITLRWLAGGSYLDICFAFGISRGTFYKDNGVLWGTIGAIDDFLIIGIYYIIYVTIFLI